jgi:hypothetical protein
VFPTLMLVPLRHGSASEPSSEAQALVDDTPRPFLLPLSDKRAGASKPPTTHAYHYIPAGEGQASAVSKGKRPVLPGHQEEDTFFTSKSATRADQAVERGDEDERDLGADTEVDELDQGDHEVDELEDDDEGIVRGRSREAVLPTSDVRSSSPALIRSSSPVVLLKERQQLKRRGSSADDKKDGKKEQDAKREKLMLFPSSSSIEVESGHRLVNAKEPRIVEIDRDQEDHIGEDARESQAADNWYRRYFCRGPDRCQPLGTVQWPKVCGLPIGPQLLGWGEEGRAVCEAC